MTTFIITPITSGITTGGRRESYFHRNTEFPAKILINCILLPNSISILACNFLFIPSQWVIECAPNAIDHHMSLWIDHQVQE